MYAVSSSRAKTKVSETTSWTGTVYNGTATKVEEETISVTFTPTTEDIAL